MANRYVKKVLDITNHQGNANKNHNEISPHTCQNGYCQKGKGKGNPCVLLVGMYIGTATKENNMEFPQFIKNRTTIRSSNSTPGYITEENETLI